MGLELDQKEAQQLARLFNVAFNSAGLYGGQHPTTKKSVSPLFDAITEIFQAKQSVSFIIDRGNLFIEDVCVDKTINIKRAVNQFAKSGLESVTFERGVGLYDIITFVSMAGDNVNVYKVDEMNKALEKSGCTKIKLNYVHFDIVTGDQAIVDSNGNDSEMIDRDDSRGSKMVDIDDSPDSEPDEKFPECKANNGTSQDISEILSLAHLLEKPHETAQKFTETVSKLKNTAQVADAFSDIKLGLNQPMSSSALETLLGSISQLKADLSEAIEVQKITGDIISRHETVSKHFDELTCDVIVKLILQEYHQGETSLKRLAQIIRRMLPDISELKTYLPKMKDALLSSGMPLKNYLELLRLLNVELESERLAGALSDAASSIGVTEKELISAIESQPQEAARLIYLAAEIRKGTSDDDAQLSNLLTEYVEKVSSEIAIGFKDISGPHGCKILRNALLQLEKKLLKQLKEFGLDEKMLFNITKSLSYRFESVFDNAASKWINSSLLNAPEKFADNLATFLDNENEMFRYQNTLVEILKSKNYSAEQIEQFLKIASQNICEKKISSLLSGIMPSNNIIFLLDREIKQNQRYKTPFSTLLISIRSIIGEEHSEAVRNKPLVFSEIISIIKKLLRDIDLIGFLDDLGREFIFILLAMTNTDGAQAVKKRIYKAISSTKFNATGGKHSIELVISITSPQPNIKNYRSYIEMIRKNHGKELQNSDSGLNQ